jgi:hypothetical protein
VKVDDPVAEPALVLQVEPQADIAGQGLQLHGSAKGESACG